MRVRRWFCLLVGGLLAWPAVPTCEGALAASLGARPRYTARLSSNKAIRKQQLIVDPEGIVGGSASVAYDTSIVRLVGIDDPGSFSVDGGFVGVFSGNGSTLGIDLVSLDTFLSDPHRGSASLIQKESGFVQVFFSSRDVPSLAAAAPGPVVDPASSVIPNAPGYVTVAEDGATGINDTHTLFFEFLPGVDPERVAPYRVYATPPIDGSTSDSIIPADNPDEPIPYTSLGEAHVRGSLGRADPIDAVPLPPSVWIGGSGLTALALGHWLTRRRRV